MLDINIQREFQQIIEKYNNTDRNIIKANIKTILRKIKKTHRLKTKDIAEKLGLSPQCIAQMGQLSGYYKPDFFTVLKLCNLLNISITETLNPVQISKEVKAEKWTTEAKRQFLQDYMTLNITELTQKYGITQRSAVEYFRLFKRDLEKQNLNKINILSK